MKNIRPLIAGCLIAGYLIAGALTAGPAFAQQQDDPIPGISSEPTLPDPVEGQGANYPASIATATTAYGGVPKASPTDQCSPFNPCALASSAPHKQGVVPGLTH